MKKYKLDKEEQEILDAVERGEYISDIKNKKELEKYQKYAEYTLKKLKKNKNINIRLPERTLLMLRNRANEEGIPYQTLISSILHKYVNRTL